MDGNVVANARRDESLDIRQRAGFWRLRLGVVEAEPIRRDQRSGLAHMIPEHRSQGRVQEMCRGVVAHEAMPAVQIDGRLGFVVDGDVSGGDDADVCDEVPACLGVVHADLPVFGGQRARVALLPTPFGVERRAREDHLDLLPFVCAFHGGAIDDQADDHAAPSRGVVAGEVAAAIDTGVDGGVAAHAEVGGGAAPLALGLHG